MNRLRFRKTKAPGVFQASGRPQALSVKKRPMPTGSATGKGISPKRQLRKATPISGKLRKRRAAARPKTAKRYNRPYRVTYNNGYNVGFAKGFEDGHLNAYVAQP